MRNTVVAVLGVLLLAGCSTTQAATPAGQDRRGDTQAATIPSPDPAQTSNLLAGLRKIDPELDHERSIGRARDTCLKLLAGNQTRSAVVKATQQRFDGAASVSLADARRIVALVEDSGWCR